MGRCWAAAFCLITQARQDRDLWVAAYQHGAEDGLGERIRHNGSFGGDYYT